MTFKQWISYFMLFVGAGLVGHLIARGTDIKAGHYVIIFGLAALFAWLIPTWSRRRNKP